VTERFRVGLRPLRPKFIALPQRLRLVGNLSTHDYARPRRDREQSAELPLRIDLLRPVRFEIPIRRAHGLPYAVPVRFATDSRHVRCGCVESAQERKSGESEVD